MTKELDVFIKREKYLWHKHFIPSFIAGIAVGLLSFLYKATLSNIILFASVGASAVILAHSTSHHLLKLRTTIIAYITAIMVSIGVYILNQTYPLNISLTIAISVFIVTMLMYLLNSFHPPAITASLSFTILERPIIDLAYLFIAILALFIIIRLITHTLSQNLSIKHFLQEFKKSFD